MLYLLDTDHISLLERGDAIGKYKPKQVIFVGVSNAKYWSLIQAGIPYVEFETITHPAARVQTGTVITPTIPLFQPTVNGLPKPVQIVKGNLMQNDEKLFLNKMYVWTGKQYKQNGNPDQAWQKIATRNTYEIYLSFVASESSLPLCIEYKLSGISGLDKDKIKSLLDELRTCYELLL